jgi:hypothetical protein
MIIKHMGCPNFIGFRKTKGACHIVALPSFTLKKVCYGKTRKL